MQKMDTSNKREHAYESVLTSNDDDETESEDNCQEFLHLAGYEIDSPSYLAEQNSQNLSFTKKLFDILSNDNYKDIITWLKDGMSFEVLNPRALELKILPKYFRHTRFQSLVRQLNFYSFKKVGKERSSWVYCHEYFRRDEPNLLSKLKRKTNCGAREAMIAASTQSQNQKRTLNVMKMSKRVPAINQITFTGNPSLQAIFCPLFPQKIEAFASDKITLKHPAPQRVSTPDSQTTSSVYTPSMLRMDRVDSTPWDPLCNLENLSPTRHLSSPKKENRGFQPVSLLSSYISVCSKCSQQENRHFSFDDDVYDLDRSLTNVENISSHSCATGETDSDSGSSSSNTELPSRIISSYPKFQSSIPSKAALAIGFRNMLLQRNLSIDSLDRILSLLFKFNFLSISEFSSEVKIERLAALKCQVIDHLISDFHLAHEVAMYMQVLGFPLDQLPYYKTKLAMMNSGDIHSISLGNIRSMHDSESQNYMTDTVMQGVGLPSIFSGKLTKCQVSDIMSNFLRFSLNLIRDIQEQLRILSQFACKIGLVEHDACSYGHFDTASFGVKLQSCFNEIVAIDDFCRI